MKTSAGLMIASLLVIATTMEGTNGYTINPISTNNHNNHKNINKHNIHGRRQRHTKIPSATTMMQMAGEEIPDPTTFREAEILGLRLMQEGNFEEALVAFQMGMKLPGSRPDIRRTKNTSGPSPVGGSFGGTASETVMSLDDFELQAAHYNMACAHARLGNIDDSILNLAKSFENGFDNYATVRGDPDLDPIKMSPDFERLMDEYDNKSGFNPFGFFGN